MAPSKKSKPQAAESDGEEFSDVDSNSNSSGEDLAIGEDTLTWVCPTVGPQARRNEFEAVS
jgi:hypothetical protein